MSQPETGRPRSASALRSALHPSLTLSPLLTPARQRCPALRQRGPCHAQVILESKTARVGESVGEVRENLHLLKWELEETEALANVFLSVAAGNYDALDEAIDAFNQKHRTATRTGKQLAAACAQGSRPSSAATLPNKLSSRPASAARIRPASAPRNRPFTASSQPEVRAKRPDRKWRPTSPVRKDWMPLVVARLHSSPTPFGLPPLVPKANFQSHKSADALRLGTEALQSPQKLADTRDLYARENSLRVDEWPAEIEEEDSEIDESDGNGYGQAETPEARISGTSDEVLQLRTGKAEVESSDGSARQAVADDHFQGSPSPRRAAIQVLKDVYAIAMHRCS